MVTKRRRSRLPKAVQQEVIRHFVTGVTARIAGCSRYTATLFFHKLRKVNAAKLARQSPVFSDEIEVDESYFGGHRKGSRSRSSTGASQETSRNCPGRRLRNTCSTSRAGMKLLASRAPGSIHAPGCVGKSQ